MNTVFSFQISEQFQLCPNYKSKKKLVEGEHNRGLPGDMGTRIWTWTFQSKRESARKPTPILSLCFVRMRTKKKERQSERKASNVVVATHIKTEVITEHWFGEKAEGSNRSGGQCGHGDDRTEEEGDGDDEDDRS
ncbi:hypothetical protein AHAS_Ahas06G0019300 [Arachis hypogaea]